MRLRHPNPGDAPELVALARRLHAESWYCDLAFSEENAIQLIDRAIHAPDMLGLVLEAADGTVIGFLAAACARHAFCDSLYACDLALYVAPEHRGGPGLVRMIRAYEAWCRIKGVSEILIGVSSGIDIERTGRLYGKLGYGDPVVAYRKKCVWPD